LIKEVTTSPQESRKSLLTLALKEIPLDDEVDLDKIAGLLNNYSGADVTALCRDAALVSILTIS
jgi:SpoVK/Ycf46/Vps4 family AAA+-type ATPase